MKFIEYIKKIKKSLKSLSKECNIPYATLHESIKDPQKMKLENMRKISSNLNKTLDEISDMLFYDDTQALYNTIFEQKKMKLKGNLYHFTQINFTYNTNRIEGSKLTEEETMWIFDTKTVDTSKELINVDDIVETTNHFHLFDEMIEDVNKNLSEELIKKYHRILKNGTSDSLKEWFAVGEYKKLDNEVGGNSTSKVKDVERDVKELIRNYNSLEEVSFEDIIEFHYKFERIHPFQDGNGRVGRLIMFKECLKNNIIPFIILDNKKAFYYKGLKEYESDKVFLLDTCRLMQDNYKSIINKYIELKKDTI